MAARHLFLPLRRTIISAATTTGTGGGLITVKFVTSDALRTDHCGNSDDLKSQIFRLRVPKRSATNIIQKWINDGNSLTIYELRDICRDLRKSHRFKHALEITEWIVSHDEFKPSDSDYAARIDLMTRVFGIDAAERYFEGLSHAAKTSETYTALLHSYASAKFTDKAEELFHRIKNSGLSFDAITYNEMMTLYMSVGQVEKVSSIVEELLLQKVTPDLFTYNLWISSCAATLDIEGVQNILDELNQDSNTDEGWVRYRNLANIYITTGQLSPSGATSLVEAEKGITQREWITYDFLIILHAGLGNKDMIDKIWKSLRMTKQKMIGRNYIPIISSYLMLGHIKEVEEVIEQWKNTTTSVFDSSICDRLADAFAEAGFSEKAETFRLVVNQKASDSSDESN